MHQIHGQPNICTYIGQPTRLVGAAWGGLMNRVNWCWQWVLNTRVGQAFLNPLWRDYIVPLDQRDKSNLQISCALAFAVLILGRRCLNPALTPVIFLLPAALLAGGYKLVESRSRTRSNRLQIIPRLDHSLEAVQHANEGAIYPRTLDLLNNTMKQQQFVHLKSNADAYDRVRKSFEDAYGRRSIPTVRGEIIDYLTTEGIEQEQVVANFINSLNGLGDQNDVEATRTALNQAYQALQENFDQSPNQDLAQQRNRWLSRRMEEIYQPTFNTCRNELVRGLNDLRTELDRSPHPLRLILHVDLILKDNAL